MKPVTTCYHFNWPTVPKIRAAVQRLAGRNAHPFYHEDPTNDHKFRAFISPQALDYMLKRSPADTEARYVGAEQTLLDISGTGVIFRITDNVVGCFLFSVNDPTACEEFQ